MCLRMLEVVLLNPQNRPNHWIVPTIGSSIFGMGMTLVFSGVFAFLVDAYPLYAASALAANSFARSSFAAAFPLFGIQMFNKLGYQWATTLFALLSLAIAPSPIVFTVFKGSKAGDIIESDSKRPALSGDQVLISVSASGLCGGDLLFKHNDMTLGHEGVGVVVATGPEVQSLTKGVRCGTDVFCPERKMYGRSDLDQGSLAYGIVKKESRLFPIPKELYDEEAAPLMCAGATVFNVLDTYDVKPTDRIGVIGVGGLGHLAIQFESKMGNEVIAFSSTQSKESDALAFGASAYYNDSNIKEAGLGGALDLLIVTAPALPNWGVYLPFLAPKAKIFALTIGPGNLALPNMPLLLNGITIQGSVLAPTNVHKRMLNFAAAKGVKPKVHKFVMDRDDIVEAFGVLKEGKMRYRGVLVVPEENRLK
ncbi:hypothetical protein BTUL_0039g00290 [Botrytis tulipae]|uniref:Enoyl reductase (ER) domain-containing protein n=1 Tax=Botrytis tulipae TaxID=87230 RepID=A0A4Z1EYH5_9HELO|nr:hypothetical protein BTUL_0039g00290 [Botrytis tulipae]